MEFFQEVWAICKEHPGAVAALVGAGGLLVGFLRLLFYIFFEGRKVVSNSEESSPDPNGTEVDIEFKERIGKNSDWIVVTNDGPNPVEEVVPTVLNETSRSNPFVKGDWSKKSGCRLEPNQEVKFMAATSKDSQPPYDVKVSWKDEDGVHEKEKTIYR